MTQKYKKFPKYRPRAWLWWVAFVVAALGGGYYYYLTNNIKDPATYQQTMFHARVTLMITSLIVLVCMISATAQLWFKR